MDIDHLREALGSYLRDRAERDEFSGVVRVDQANSTIFEQAHGLASRAWQVPISVNTRFDTASITKLFTAVAFLQQVQAGAFALDTSVVEYLGLSDTTISREVTPYHLLTHTSGIGDDADEEAGERYEDLFVDKPNYALRNTADCLPNFIHKQPNFSPGDGVRYCNVSYVLLGLMIERATGLTYRHYVKQHVFELAGMERSGFFRMDGVEPDVAEGVFLEGEGDQRHWKRNIYSYPPQGAPDGGAHVTAADLIQFHQALVAGQLLNPEFTRSMLESKADQAVYDGNLRRTGFGFEFEYGSDGDLISYWKEGINVGASGILQHFTSQNVTLVVLSNIEEGAWEPIEEVSRLVTE